MSDERTKIIERAKKQLEEIKTLFADADLWNARHPDEYPINVDPKGDIQRIADGLENMLAIEDGDLAYR